MPKYPPPSDSADRLREFLEAVEAAQKKNGSAKRWDIYKKALNGEHTNRWLNYLVDRGFINGDDTAGYILAEKGKLCLELFRTRSDLIGVFTQELSGSRLRRWNS
jgi:hypothetical protein